MKIVWKQMKGDRGLWWIAYQERSIVGSIVFTFLPANSGGSFVRNHGSGVLTVRVYGAENQILKDARLPGVRYRNDADKAVRAWIRENKIRNLVESSV